MVLQADNPRTLSPPPVLKSATRRTRKESEHSLLKRISIEISRKCNLRCIYCYAESSPTRHGGLTDAEVRFVIREAVENGACRVSVVAGGEPLLRKRLFVDGESCIDYANGLGCYCYLYTNCTLMNRATARWLSKRDVSVVGKLNSLKDTVQDTLTGVAGSAKRIRRGIEALMEEGFNRAPSSRLALETIICRHNYEELPDLWRWMRTRNIIPEVEIMTVHGRGAKNRKHLYFSDEEAPRKYKAVFEELLKIDREEFGYDWVAHPPFPAAACQLYYNNCYVNDRGGVQPCAGVDETYGFLQVGSHRTTGRPLAEIVGSKPFQKLRRIHEYVGEPCKNCDLLHTCYGCRGAAWNLTGDLFAGDPICWRRQKSAAGKPRRPLVPPAASPMT
jgi:radical SAM protein with 4Fe4S-binding SPASM domain